MKKPLLLASLLFTLFTNAQVWKQTLPGPPFPETTHGITAAGTDTMWMAGNARHVLRTYNNGQSWEKVWPATGVTTWYTCYFLNSLEGYAVGSSGMVSKTIDGGHSWSSASLGTFTIYSAFFLNRDTGWISGSGGNIYQTTNAGTSWIKQTVSPTSTIGDIYFITRDTGFATTSSTTLLRTYNGGNTWSTVSLGSGLTTSRFSFLNKDTGWVTTGSRIYATFNRGINWTSQSIIAAGHILQVSKDTSFCTTQNILLRTLNGGTTWDTIHVFTRNQAAVLNRYANSLFCTNGVDVIRSLNRGATWDTLITGYTIYPSSINAGYMPDPGTGWIVGPNGWIGKTQDTTVTWTTQLSGTTKSLTRVYALNRDTAWVAGNGIMLRTYNGGATWDSIWHCPFTPAAITFINKDTGFAIGSTSSIYRTINGGNTWATVTHNGTTSSYKDICFLNKDTGFICGASANLLSTSDGGNSWTKVPVPVTYSFDMMSFSGDHAIIVSTSNSMHSLDRGRTWTSKASSPTSISFQGLKMISPHAILATASGRFIKSADFGASWQSIPTDSIMGAHNQLLYADSFFIAAGASQRILTGRGNWTLIPMLDSLSADSFVNTDSVSFIAYGKNFDLTSVPVSISNTNVTYSLLSAQQMRVSYKRSISSSFPVAYYSFYISNTGEKAGRTATLRFTVYDTLPLTPASDIVMTSRDSSKYVFGCTKGSGTGRMVILRKDAPVNRFPSNDTGTYIPSTIFGSGTHLGDGNYVISFSPAIGYSITNLEPNATYHYAIIEYTRSSVPRNFNNHIYTSGSFRTSNVYYNKASGALNRLSSWSTRPDGSGDSPLNFGDSFTYYLPNYSLSPFIDSSWSVSGFRSYVVFGNGTNPFNYYIFPGSTVNIDSLRIRSNVTITNDGEFLFRKSFFETGSLIQFISSASQKIAPATYQEVTVTGGEKLLLGDIQVNGLLNMIGDINCNGNTLQLSNSANPAALNHLGGMMKNGRFTRHVHPSPAINLFPLGIGNQYRPAYISYSAIYQFSMSYLDTFISNSGLPLFDATLSPLVRINRASTEGIWRIERAPGISYTLAVTATGYSGISDSSALRLIKRSTGGSWSLQGSALPVTGTNAAPVVSRSGLSGVGEYGIGSDTAINVLPVKLLGFSGIRIQGSNRLTWTTSLEANNKGFRIYRSSDNRTWHEAGFVSGAGRASGYRFLDPANGTGPWYYFLGQEDHNGSVEYSAVITVDEYGDMREKISIWPNPVSGTTLSFNGSLALPAELHLYNAAGSKIRTIAVSGNEDLREIAIDDLEPGLYFLQVTDGTGSYTEKFIRL